MIMNFKMNEKQFILKLSVILKKIPPVFQICINKMMSNFSMW